MSATNAEVYLKREPSSFEFAEVESSRVLKLLFKLDITKATGLDQISNKVLKVAAPVIYKQLTELFNLSLKSGEYPDDWKLAKVIPVFKAGERNDPNNYRPISILSTISRVFEKLVYEQIYNCKIVTLQMMLTCVVLISVYILCIASYYVLECVACVIV